MKNRIAAVAGIFLMMMAIVENSYGMGSVKKAIKQITGKTGGSKPAAVNHAPVINTVSPGDNSEYLAGRRIEIKVSASDADNDKLQYQFTVGGAVKQAYSSNSSYIWQTSSADTGSVGIVCEVKDAKNAVVSKAISLRIINPSAADVLKRIADNYAKISDFSADMEVMSVLDGNQIGEKSYCRYYMKAPDKIKNKARERTESYSDKARTQKTEVIVINDYTMYVLDAEDKLVEEVNMLEGAGIDAAQFSQMDILYDQEKFLSSHTITKDNSKTNYTTKVIVLTAVPKQKNKLYSKIELSVDYDKGLLTKSVLYKENEETKNEELVETTEITASKQMAGGEWVPVKMRKRPKLSAGSLISNLVYSNIRINSGLDEQMFERKK